MSIRDVPETIRRRFAALTTGGAAIGAVLLGAALSRHDAQTTWVTVAVAGSVLLFGLNVLSRSDLVARLTVWGAVFVLVGVTEQRVASDVATTPASMLNVLKAGAVATALLIVMVTRPRRVFPLSVPEWFLAGYVVVAFTSAVWSVNAKVTTFAAAQLALAYLCVLLLARLRPSIHAITRDIAAAMYVLVLSTVAGLLLVPDRAFGVDVVDVPRLQGVFPQISTNLLGFVAAVAVVMLIANVGPRWARYPVVRWSLVVASTVVLLLSRTRSAIGLLLIGAVLLLIWMHRWRLALVAIPVVLGVAYLSSGVVAGVVVPFLRRGQTTEQLVTLTGRTSIWDAALTSWRQQPLTGYGFYAGHRIGPLIGDRGFEVSNFDSTWIETLYDVGVIGFIPLAAAAVASLWFVLREPDSPPVARAVLVMCLIVSTYNPTLQMPSYALIVWGLLIMSRLSPHPAGERGSLRRPRRSRDGPTSAPLLTR